jgi:nicotinate phosphoribosyltransferase
LLNLVVDRGKVLTPPESLEQIAARTAASVTFMTADQRRIESPIVPEIHYSDALLTLTETTRRGDRR